MDLGTGCGCILLSLVLELGCKGVGIDINSEALNIAQKNAIQAGISSKISFYQSSWLSNLKDYSFEIIVSNPPYISEIDYSNLDPTVKE